MNKIKAMIFDLDGTLLDTVADIMDSCNAGLAASGFPPHGLEAYKYFIGDGIEELVRRALPEDKRNEKMVKECLAIVTAEYKKRWHNKTKPYDGIIDMLKTINEKNIPMAIFSNKPHDFTEDTVNYYFPEIKFSFVLGAKECNPKKPDPWGALYIAKNLAISTEEFAYLGDTAVDIATAKAASMLSVGAGWGFRGKEELENAGADYIVEKPEEFLELINSLK
jgi:phosphoglycolate phosphatase